MKDKWNNETNKMNKRIQEKGPRGVSRSKGSKTSSITQHHTTLWDVARQTKCLELENSLVAS